MSDPRAPAPLPKSSRDTRIDALRGLFLVIMAAVHVPTPLSRWLHEPFGYVSAAEGFVFLGACLAGFVYSKVRRRHGAAVMNAALFARMRKIYFVHLGVLVATALIVWPLGGRVTPLGNHFHDFLQHPWASLALMPLLLHQPPLFDILPLYIIFFALTPAVLRVAERRGWAIVLGLSAAVWLVAQFQPFAHLTAGLSHRSPLRLSAFNLLAWQALWIGGLATGETLMREPLAMRKHRRWLMAPALLVIAAGLLCRHGILLRPTMVPHFQFWVDKWRLGPLRALDVAAWALFLWSWSPQPPRALTAPTALLGRHSLAVFALHIPLAIVASTAIQLHRFSAGAQVAIGAAVIGAMFAFAARIDSGRWLPRAPRLWWNAARARLAPR